MQNRYVGDVGDFAKYGLLRALIGTRRYADGGPRLSLGVVWYLVSDEDNTDGGRTEYLETSNEPRFRNCDQELYDKLKEIVERDQRSVGSVQGAGIFPEATAFYGNLLTFEGLPLKKEARIAGRQEWLNGALSETKNCDLVFFDPDNGLECQIGPSRKKGPKYVFFDELDPFVKRGQTIVVYQHANRRCRIDEQIQRRLEEIKRRLTPISHPLALVFHRWVCRMFFIVPNDKHSEIFQSRTNHFIEGPWSEHFSVHGASPQPVPRIREIGGKLGAA